LIGRSITAEDAPNPMIDYFNEMSGDDALEEFAAWKEVLKESFGPRRFIKMDLQGGDLYDKLNQEK
jgi:hypothetical protein